MFVLSIFETIALPLTMDEFSWKASDADVYNGIISGTVGIQSVFFFASAKGFATKFGNRKTLAIGFIIVILAQLAAVPYAGPKLHAENGGDCNDSWCDKDPKLTIEQYLFSVILINAGFPLSSVMIFSIYSSVLGPFHQGAWMGIINGCGSAARAIGPLLITMAYSAGGPTYIFGGAAVLAGLVFLVFLTFSNRLVPFGTRTRGSYSQIG